jgi:bifunctional UDP-N-acetylglucosamine pyrophosphorylase/glucosamine-1-phosphate N-acetyltransferase
MLLALQQAELVLLTESLADPTGYGRIVRDDGGRIVAIVEHKDATEEQLAIKEINTGIMAVNRARLEDWLSRIDNLNAKQEYYLTDIIARAVQGAAVIETISPANEEEVMGINELKQLAYLERHVQCERANALMKQGVTLADPARLDIRGELITGKDVYIDCNAIFEGRVELADGVRIGPNVLIKNALIKQDVEILANSVIEDAVIGAGSRIGPFARIRPETELAEHVHIGNFVELKKTRVAPHSKINHLSYVGDSLIGSKVNIGAGTITCNYDGANKHQTVIGDRAFIGSDTQLIAPVSVGEGATIGAGSTITQDTPPNKLTLSRAKQISIDKWQRPVKKVKD